MANPASTFGGDPADPAAGSSGDQGGISGDMVSITLPKELLDVLVQILQTAQQKATTDIGDKAPDQGGDLAGLGDELSGSSRAPMQAVPR